MHVSGRCGVPDPHAIRQRFGPSDFVQSQRFSVESACLRFLTWRVEDLRVMKRNRHEIECTVGYHVVRPNRQKGTPLMAIEQQETGTQIDQPVVTMTARATDKLKEVIAKQGRADLALRVYVTPGGCSGFSYGITFAEGREQEDTLVEHDGVRIVVDPMSAMYLKGSEIDFVDALMGGGFALRNPNAVSSCGCGQSFKTAGQSGTAKACAH